MPFRNATLVDSAASEILLAGKITPPPEMVRPTEEAKPPPLTTEIPPLKVEVAVPCKRSVPEVVILPEVSITKVLGI